MSKSNPELTDADNPGWTEDMFERATLGPAAATRMGRPKSESPKVLKTLRLSPEVLAFFQAGGKGWQARINEVLAEYVKSRS